MKPNSTILVVDDEPDLRELLQQVLEMHGYNVLQAGSGKEALEVWEKNSSRIDLLLTDLIMPEGMSGVALAGRLQTHRPLLKVVYTSGHPKETAVEKYSLPPDSRFLQKPFNPSALAQLIQSCLEP
ncbi:MAG: response regulator [Verrucomicrobiota bacterium]